MPATTFSSFLRLPKEIQIQIFKEASYIHSTALGPPDSQAVDLVVFLNIIFGMVKHLQSSFPNAYPGRVFTFFALLPRCQIKTRLSLMHTSSLARIVALEAWRKDLTDAPTAHGNRHIRATLLSWLEQHTSIAGGRL